MLAEAQFSQSEILTLYVKDSIVTRDISDFNVWVDLYNSHECSITMMEPVQAYRKCINTSLLSDGIYTLVALAMISIERHVNWQNVPRQFAHMEIHLKNIRDLSSQVSGFQACGH